MSRVLYGINPAKEIIRHKPGEVRRLLLRRHKGGELEEIVKMAAENGITIIHHATSQELEKVTGTKKNQSVAVIADDYRYVDLDDIVDPERKGKGHALILVLDGIEDPMNLGSLVRSADAAGAAGLVIPKERAAAVTPAVVKASAGATEVIPITRVTNIARTLEWLKGKGIWVLGIEAGSELDIYSMDLKRDLAVVVGSEGGGIRRIVRERCDFCASIPMAGKIRSLNASVAGAVALFEAVRQNRDRKSGLNGSHKRGY